MSRRRIRMAQLAPGRTVTSEQRFEREWRVIENSPEVLQQEGISVERTGKCEVKARVTGPTGTPYEGGSFELIIECPESYPYKPPKVHFTYPHTRIWHPNVCVRTGTVSTVILKSDWILSLTLRTVLISIRALLSTPEPRQWINYAAGRQYVRQREIFEATARFWAQLYANAPGEKDRGMRTKVARFTRMGVHSIDAVRELSCADWDVDQATEMLFS